MNIYTEQSTKRIIDKSLIEVEAAINVYDVLSGGGTKRYYITQCLGILNDYRMTLKAFKNFTNMNSKTAQNVTLTASKILAEVATASLAPKVALEQVRANRKANGIKDFFKADVLVYNALGDVFVAVIEDDSIVDILDENFNSVLPVAPGAEDILEEAATRKLWLKETFEI